MEYQKDKPLTYSLFFSFLKKQKKTFCNLEFIIIFWPFWPTYCVTQVTRFQLNRHTMPYISLSTLDLSDVSVTMRFPHLVVFLMSPLHSFVNQLKDCNDYKWDTSRWRQWYYIKGQVPVQGCEWKHQIYIVSVLRCLKSTVATPEGFELTSFCFPFC